MPHFFRFDRPGIPWAYRRGDEEVGRRAGLYVRDFKKSHGVSIGDALIAASAILSSAELWTRKRKHYPMKELAFFQ